MIEHYIHKQIALDRLRANPIRDAIYQLADYLHGLAYAETTAQGYLQAAEHYGYWLGHLSDDPLIINARSVEAFIEVDPGIRTGG